MRALVTGGAGFIGSHLVDALLDRGDQVRVIDALTTGRLENLAHRSDHPGLGLIEASILDGQLLDRDLAWADVAFHLAAVVGMPGVLRDPIGAARVNLSGTERMLEGAAAHGCRVVLASSSEVYGQPTRIPLREDQGCLLGPSGTRRWSYAAAKLMGEHLALAYADRGLPVTALRYFNCYGPRQQGDGHGYAVVARFMAQALRRQPLTVHGDGRQTRSFTYVADTVAATLLAAERTEAVGQVINVGRSEEIAIADLARLVVEVTGSTSSLRHVPYREVFGDGHEDIRRRVPDPEKARRVLEFAAQVPLDDGLSRTVAWWKEVVPA